MIKSYHFFKPIEFFKMEILFDQTGKGETVMLGYMQKGYRIVKARGNFEFTHREMVENGIRAVYNSVGGIDAMGPMYVIRFQRNVTNIFRGEVSLVETAIKKFPGHSSPLKVVSVIVFHSEWGFNLYLMRNPDVSDGLIHYALCN